MCDYVCHAPRRPRRSNRTILSETARPNQIEADARLRGPTDRGREVGGCPSARLLGDLHRDTATAAARLGAARRSAARRVRPGTARRRPVAARLRAAGRTVYGPPVHKPGVVALRPLGPRRLLRRRVQDDPPQPHARWSGWRPWSPRCSWWCPCIVTLALAAAGAPHPRPAAGPGDRVTGLAPSTAAPPRWSSGLGSFFGAVRDGRAQRHARAGRRRGGPRSTYPDRRGVARHPRDGCCRWSA